MTVQQIRDIFKHLETGDGGGFFARVAGHYRGKADFVAHTFEKLAKVLPQGTQLHVENVLQSGDWAVVELRSLATAKNGLRFDNRYCWVCRFRGDTIVEVRAYLDSALVARLFQENPI
jgi:uncharacterized protein